MAKAKKTDNSAAPNPDAAAPEGGDTDVQIGVKMKVTTKGDGRIHKGSFITGTHVPELYKKGETFLAPDQQAADILMDRGLADTTDE